MPGEAAIIADIKTAIRPQREAIRRAFHSRNRGFRAIGRHFRDAPRFNFDQRHRPIGHGNRAFGEAQPLGQDFEVGCGDMNGHGFLLHWLA